MRSNWKPFGVAAAVGVMLSLLAWVPADAQPKPSTAQVTRAIGRVEAVKKGQSQWNPIRVGAQLVEGDQIRANPGGSADLSLPDGSSILVAENTRFVVTRLDYDTQTRERFMTFHLVVGKIRATVTRAAVQVVKSRQSNFLISTPTGVAAVRGTIATLSFTPGPTGGTFLSVQPSAGQTVGQASVTFIVPATATNPGGTLVVTGNTFTTTNAQGVTSAPQALTTLSAQAQANLATAVNAVTNPLVAASLTAVTVEIPLAVANTITQVTTGLGIGTIVGTPPPPPPPVATSGR